MQIVCILRLWGVPVEVQHGDLQGYHANVGPDGMLTFFDFDCGGYGYRAYDLAVFVWCCRLAAVKINLLTTKGYLTG